jgi:hypothetical protein
VPDKVRVKETNETGVRQGPGFGSERSCDSAQPIQFQYFDHPRVHASHMYLSLSELYQCVRYEVQSMISKFDKNRSEIPQAAP